MAQQTAVFRMTAAEVFDRMRRGGNLFVLDVRNEDVYADWRIEGPSVRSANVPYVALLDDLEALEGKLPPEPEPILVVCAKEGASQYVAEQLSAGGRRSVSVLSGGMEAWSGHMHIARIGDLSGGGALYQVARVGKGCLSYIVAAGGEAAIVDVARLIGPYEDFARRHNLKVRHLVDTHLHADHISGGRALAARQQAEYWLPPDDSGDAPFSCRPLTGARPLAVGGADVEILPLQTPGHTAGSVSLAVDGRYLLTGDTLFVESVGRPDLGGRAAELADQLYDTLFGAYRALPEDLTVLPAHYAHLGEMDREGRVQARLGDLFRDNEGLQIRDRAAFADRVTRGLPPQPHAFHEIRQVNMGRLAPGEREQAEMEIGPNRCAVHG